MLWGKLIDHDKCIGCHACSVACKSENDVPLGSFRTWVKQVEKGAGLSARRHFAVLRCNQCERAPCVTICPTAAMHRREDGIVDFDNEICIGCKACIQACPYDAIYIDPSSNTAAKCNFCAHRIEVGLQPACVSACPTEALAVSDLSDPESLVSRVVARAAVSVRKPQLGTKPKVFYKGVDQSLLDPRAAERPAQGYWGASRGTALPVVDREPQADPPGSLIPEQVSGSGAPAAARVAYDVPRDGAPWGAKISGYMLTKAIGAGALMVGGLGLLLRDPAQIGLAPPVLALAMLTLTTLLLVADLKRPERFLLLLVKAQSQSWLVRGAYALIGGSVVASLWGVLLLAQVPVPRWGWQALGVAAICSGIFAAGYTAFLFAQAKGRLFWQSPLLFPHLVVQAMVAGSAALTIPPLLLDPLGSPSAKLAREGLWLTLGIVLFVSLVLNLLMIAGELLVHGDEDARYAVRWLQTGERGTGLNLGVFALGHVFPFVALSAALMLPGAGAAVPLAALAALAGLWLWDHLYVLAGQAPPLS
ncbi:MAG TPA: 4Fe-4S ferredoxin [Planctomycetes bacterium]|nr:4Fe-4S ferredoxin [Planctomycetota bacterium]